MNTKERIQQIKATQLQLSKLDSKIDKLSSKVNELLSEVRELKYVGCELEKTSNFSELKAEVAEELLKDTHKLSDQHKISGDDGRDYPESVGDEDLAEEVKYLVLPLDRFPVAFAEIQEPDGEILLFKTVPPGRTWNSEADWYYKGDVAHGSTKEEAWAKAFDLYCSELI